MGFPAFLSKHRGANRAEAAAMQVVDIIDHGDFLFCIRKLFL
jgi:hypothetical protein